MGVVCAIRKKKVSYFFWPNDILYYFSYFFRCGKEKYKKYKENATENWMFSYWGGFVCGFMTDVSILFFLIRKRKIQRKSNTERLNVISLQRLCSWFYNKQCCSCSQKKQVSYFLGHNDILYYFLNIFLDTEKNSTRKMQHRKLQGRFCLWFYNTGHRYFISINNWP